MNEILSTIQSLMAMFILPTQQSVLERSLLTAFGASPLALPQVPQPTGGGGGGGVHETRLLNTLG
ncbi:MAG: hypothetical protein GWN84_06320, partial [Gammaproteobacteria bacterium]|nr:hypothetical protein [Gammaproteobacteria bacterium]NIR97346.1 hypothetical protein [Gammaproteobacteria bacterium]